MEDEAKLSAPTPAAPVEPPLPDEEQVTYATPLQMMWWRFKRHKMAIFGASILLVCYFVMIFADFFAPYEPGTRTPYM